MKPWHCASCGRRIGAILNDGRTVHVERKKSTQTTVWASHERFVQTCPRCGFLNTHIYPLTQVVQ